MKKSIFVKSSLLQSASNESIGQHCCRLAQVRISLEVWLSQQRAEPSANYFWYRLNAPASPIGKAWSGDPLRRPCAQSEIARFSHHRAERSADRRPYAVPAHNANSQYWFGLWTVVEIPTAADGQRFFGATPSEDHLLRRVLMA